MKIALIQTVRDSEARPDIGLSILYLKAYLEKYDPGKYDIDVYFANRRFSAKELKGPYELFGLSTVTCQYETAKQIAGDLRKKFRGITVLLGGAHISSAPESLSGEFDYGVIGEGEETLRQICQLISGAGRMNHATMSEMPGLIFRDKDEIKQTAPRKVIGDINRIPFPDYKIFLEHSHIPALLTSRGCPFSCSMCANHVWGSNKVRFCSAETIYRAMLDIVNLNPDCRVIVFKDDIFTMKKNMLRQLCRLAKDDSVLKNIKLVCQGHVKFVDDETLSLLADMNFKKIIFGFESMSSQLLKKINKKTTPEDNLRAMELCARHGIWCGGNFMIGFPEEKEDDIIANYDFMLENIKSGKLFMATTSILMPFPGTGYWNIARQKGLLSNNGKFNWDRTEDIPFVNVWENSNRSITMKDYWQMRQDLGLLYIGSQPADKMQRIMERYEVELFELQADNIALDRAN